MGRQPLTCGGCGGPLHWAQHAYRCINDRCTVYWQHQGGVAQRPHTSERGVSMPMQVHKS